MKKTIFKMKLTKEQKQLVDEKLIHFPIEFKMDKQGNVYGKFDIGKEWEFLWEGIPF